MSEETGSNDDRRAQARASFTGRSLTEGQFDEAFALSGILAREIGRSGTFRDKLSDYAHAFARTERFDAMRGEEIIRDIFKARYGETMNQMREGLMAREEEIGASIEGKALSHARFITELIQTAPTMPFYQAYDRAAVAMATAHAITENGAKDMMKTAFAAHEGRELYEAGKEAEELFHKPTLDRTRNDEQKPQNGFRRWKSRSRS